VISVRGLTKRYGRRRVALDGLDLEVPSGAIYGFIGQNGAGKTTTIRTLATLLVPDEGEADVAGIDVLRHPAEARARLGYMPDFFGVYDDLKVDEYLDFYAHLHGVGGPGLPGLRDKLLELVDLLPRRNDYVSALSRGMQQRLCLARALVHDPDVLLLDEPASGLDPIARVDMRELLKELGRMGKTILISSHILSELTDLCTHVGIVANGRMLRQGALGDVLWAVERPGFVLRVIEPADAAARVLQALPGVGAIEVDDESGDVHFRCEGGAQEAAEVVAAIVASGLHLARFGEAEGSLEAAFVHLAREAAGAAGSPGNPGTASGMSTPGSVVAA
jgi:ABC-2 type transport system ATP-binding protein